MRRLNELLDQKDQQLREKIQQANEWAEKYFELEKRLSETTDDAQLSEKAAGYLHEGELDKAEGILNGLLQREEQIVERAAADNFNLALILDLQFQPGVALVHLEKAYHYRPDNVEYAHQYARALESGNRLDEAEEVYRQNLPRIRELARSDKSVYLPLEAKTLHNLGSIYLISGRSKEAEASYEGALDLYETLAATDPSVYLLLQATTLEDLGSVYEKKGMADRAEGYYRDSLSMFNRVAAEFGTVYNVDAAMLLDHLGAHFAQKQDSADAEAMFNEVLSIGRAMAASDPAGYGMARGFGVGASGHTLSS